MSDFSQILAKANPLSWDRYEKNIKKIGVPQKLANNG